MGLGVLDRRCFCVLDSGFRVQGLDFWFWV